MSGNQQALKNAFELLRPNGRVSILGVFSGEMSIDISRLIVFKSARVYGINGRKMFQTWYKVREILKGGLVDPIKIVTHRFRLKEYEKGMEIMKSGNSGKVVFTL